jgi:hypothetical protein
MFEKLLRTKRTHLLVICIALILLDTWLMVNSARPQITPHSAAFEKIDLKMNGQAMAWERAPFREKFILQRAGREIAQVDDFLALIGPVQTELRLQISLDEPQLVEVAATRIRLGIQILKEPGALSEAVLRAWVLQNSNERIRTSPLRAQTVSRTLAALMRGDELALAPSNWLQNLAEGKASDSAASSISTLSRLMSQEILKTFAGHTWNERLHLLRAWKRFLVAARIQANPVLILDMKSLSLGVWKETAESELATIWLAPIHLAKGHLDLAIHTDMYFSDIHFARGTTALVQERNGAWRLWPSGRLVKCDSDQLKTSFEIWTSHNIPSVADLLNLPGSAHSVLFVHLGADIDLDLDAYLQEGAELFAKTNPKIGFAHFQRSSLQLAQEKGWVPKSDFLNQLLLAENGFVPEANVNLGLLQKVWNVRAQAYRVLGPLQTVDWFRSSVQQVSFSL